MGQNEQASDLCLFLFCTPFRGTEEAPSPSLRPHTRFSWNCCCLFVFLPQQNPRGKLNPLFLSLSMNLLWHHENEKKIWGFHVWLFVNVLFRVRLLATLSRMVSWNPFFFYFCLGCLHVLLLGSSLNVWRFRVCPKHEISEMFKF